VVAAWVIAYARLRLYDAIEKVESRIIYFDTGSLIYSAKPGEPLSETGQFLGDLTRELRKFGEGSYITSFVSVGAKNYDFSIACDGNRYDLKTVCKVKCLSINSGSQHLVNLKLLKAWF